mgnify:CR=1 FL=1
MIRKICVYCGSNPGNRPDYIDAARRLAGVLVEKGIDLVYGGAGVGIMGAIASTVMEKGGHVTGIMPEGLVEKEIAHPSLSEMHVVGTMHERKALMADLADGFIAMPGGLGTSEELFEVWTWAQLGMHEKPCGLFNVCGYYNPLVSFLDHATAEGFISPTHRGMLIVESDPGKLLEQFKIYQAPRAKNWIERALKN